MASQPKQCSSSELTTVERMSGSIRVECLTSDNYHEFSTACRLILHKVADQFLKNACNNPKLSAIAFYEGTCAGVIFCEDKRNSSLAITNIGVLDEFRRRGVGTALMNHAYNIAKELKSITTLEFVVVGENQNAKKLAESAGFSALPNAHSTTIYFMKNVLKDTVAVKADERTSDVTSKQDNKFKIRSLQLSDIKTLKVLNQTVVLDSFKRRFYKYVKSHPEFSAVATVNNTLIGAVCCEKKRMGVYKLLHILTLVVADEYKSLKLDIQRALLNHVGNLAEDSNHIEKITVYVKKTDISTINILKSMKFKQWKTSVNDSIYYPLNENVELYFTKNVTKNMFPIPKALKRSKNRDISLLADNAVLEMLMENARSRIVALKPDTVQVLKQLNDQIFGPGSSDTMLANVLVEPNLTFMAFRNDVPVGLIDCTTFPTVNDRSSLLIKYLGVLPDYRRKGVAADLIKHMVQFAKNTEKLDSICTNVLENNEPARKTFLGSGFVQSGTNPQTSGDVTVLVYAMNTNVNH